MIFKLNENMSLIDGIYFGYDRLPLQTKDTIVVNNKLATVLSIHNNIVYYKEKLSKLVKKRKISGCKKVVFSTTQTVGIPYLYLGNALKRVSIEFKPTYNGVYRESDAVLREVSISSLPIISNGDKKEIIGTKIATYYKDGYDHIFLNYYKTS